MVADRALMQIERKPGVATWLWTAATVTVERPDGEPAVSVQADELGRFVLDELRAGAVRLHVLLRSTQVAVPWTSI